ncbi:YigZ family protein [Streptomyces sp. DSM 42041]|uniref:YigZ family protein n=1 Tax=Streptomyces hazeniae TaxID=3075538 RepID=A0ABU2NWW1_9ACTN|nr:YigZ family protein [Streptomyces sp. DSM 42041]MDT0381470.1 YigZ family protein [Streptomyces sp. DSM 42041]
MPHERDRSDEQQDGYLTVAAEGVHETEVNRSRFRCLLAPAATEEQAQEVIARVRREHPTASHHCWAYVIGADAGVQRSGDDGEPGGTAGLPMLQMLTRRETRCLVAVVSRWFGGTKLGAGGLIRAYGGAVGAALDAVGTVERRRCRLVTVTVGHERAGRLENDLRAVGDAAVLDVRYGAEVTLDLALPAGAVEDFRARLADATAGTARLELGGDTYAAGGTPPVAGGGTAA